MHDTPAAGKRKGTLAPFTADRSAPRGSLGSVANGPQSPGGTRLALAPRPPGLPPLPVRPTRGAWSGARLQVARCAPRASAGAASRSSSGPFEVEARTQRIPGRSTKGSLDGTLHEMQGLVRQVEKSGTWSRRWKRFTIHKNRESEARAQTRFEGRLPHCSLRAQAAVPCIHTSTNPFGNLRSTAVNAARAAIKIRASARAGDAKQDAERRLVARPMLGDHVWTGLPQYAAQHKSRHNRIVERPGAGDELGDEIDRRDEPGDRDPKQDLRALGTRGSRNSPRNSRTRFESSVASWQRQSAVRSRGARRSRRPTRRP